MSMDNHEHAHAWRIPVLVELAFEAGAHEGMGELRPRVDAYLRHGSVESLVAARGLVRRVCFWLADSSLDWSDARGPLEFERARIEDAILASKLA